MSEPPRAAIITERYIEMKNNKALILEISCFAALVLTIIFSGSLSSFENDCKTVRSNVFRLHVIANSDSSEDQQLKLKVRDALLLRGKEVFSSGSTKESAEKAACKNLQSFLQTAEKTIRENGKDYSVCVSVGKSSFPTRTYENITLPAGEYDALRVVIGEGKGKNWWCVMFPPLCLPAAEKKQELSDVLSDGGQALVQSKPKYEIRFWLIEKIEQLRKKQ